jgi:methylase of polypeptide subunit release factors
MTSQTLVRLLAWLETRGYDFVTPTPSTSRRAHDRGLSAGDPVRAALGWSQAFTQDSLAPELFELLQAGELLTTVETGWKSRVRVSRLGGRLFLHSAFPATAPDAVFLGPDSYRFARFLNALTLEGPVRTIAEIGCGAGVGGLVAALRLPGASVVLGDVNPKALDLAAVNAAAMGVEAQVVLSDGLAALPGPFDLVVANPPYVAGQPGRTYKDGGDLHGARLALDWSAQALDRLAPGGTFALYTGSAILDGGFDAFKHALGGLAGSMGASLSYEELDPDIFSGELRREAYDDVERIAAVGAVIRQG